MTAKFLAEVIANNPEMSAGARALLEEAAEGQLSLDGMLGKLTGELLAGCSSEVLSLCILDLAEMVIATFLLAEEEKGNEVPRGTQITLLVSQLISKTVGDAISMDERLKEGKKNG